MTTGLTRRQREIYDFIQEYISNRRHSPSYRELMLRFDISSTSSIHKHLIVMQKKGLLSWSKGGHRSIALTSSSHEQPRMVDIPLIGKIRAGSPIETFPCAETVTIPRTLVGNAVQLYGLVVQDDSLNEELAGEGDLLILDTATEAATGDMVLAIVNHHDTILKRYNLERPYIRFESSNPHIQPIIIRAEDVVIHGVLVALIRQY